MGVLPRTAEHRSNFLASLTVNNDKIIRAAIGYASRGWRVHPLRPGTKVPVLKDWPNEATTDPEVIASWWTGEYRDHNLGIVTGRASNLFVLDVDSGSGKVGVDSLAKLEEEHKPLKPTYVVQTPSGGRHYYYLWPEEIPDPDGTVPTWRNIASGALGPDLDIRAEHGQVVAPPSILSDGNRYKRLTKTEPARLPRWLAKQTRYNEPVSAIGVAVSRRELTPYQEEEARRYGQQGIDNLLAELDELTALKVAPGTYYDGPKWNQTVYNKACRLVEFANADWIVLSTEDALQLVLEHSPRDDDFTDRTIRTIFRSAMSMIGAGAAVLPTRILDLPAELPGPVAGGKFPPPESFFAKDGIQIARVAAAVNEAGDIGIGADRQFWRYEAGVWHSDRDVIRHRVFQLLRDKYRASYVVSVEDGIRASGVPDITDAIHSHLINTRSGMVDWASGRVLPHSSAYLSTVQLPVEWDPAAECPRFDRWVSEVIDPALERRLWEVIGYMVQQGNDLHRAVLLYGPGGNGKSTLIRVLKHLIGVHNTASVSLVQMTEGKFEVAELYGKQANLAGDIESRYLRETAMFKALTGQDTVMAQRKRQDPFHFVCTATPLFSANEIPRSIDNTEGYHRRWVILPMDRKVEGLRKQFDEDDLFAELPGILFKAVSFLSDLFKARAFDEPVQARIAQERFAEASDTVATWLKEDEAILLADPEMVGGEVWRKQSQIYARFRRWAGDNGHVPMSSTRFYDRLLAAKYTRKIRTGDTVFYGLKLLSNDDGSMPFQGVMSPDQYAAGTVKP